MNWLHRSTALKIAAVMMLVLSLPDMIMYEIPDLMRGMAAVDQIANANGSGPPFFMVLLGFAMDVLSIVVAYGLWRGLRWGVILGIIISAFNTLSGLAGAMFAGAMGTRVFAAVGVVLSVVTIVLCLWREQRPIVNPVRT